MERKRKISAPATNQTPIALSVQKVKTGHNQLISDTSLFALCLHLKMVLLNISQHQYEKYYK
jgi:hypothetical protein